MLKCKFWVSSCLLPLLLVACGKQTGSSPVDQVASNNAAGNKSSSAETSVAGAVTAATSANATQVASSFNFDKVSISAAPLGDFPYFGFPVGYKPQSKPVVKDFDRFSFWVGDHFEWMEGKIWNSMLSTEQGKRFSDYEITKNLETLFTAAGGVKVFEGSVPQDVVDSLDKQYRLDHLDELGGLGDSAKIYLLRRADRNIWVQLTTNNVFGSWVIAETAPFKLTAAALDNFPYLGFPAGYKELNGETKDFDRVPFWVGDHFEWVEGKIQSILVTTEVDKHFSAYELDKNLDALVVMAGATKVFEGIMPRDAVSALDKRFVDSHYWWRAGAGDSENPVRIWRMRRNDRDVWMSIGRSGRSGALTIAETAPFKLTAALLPATELKRQIDTAGKVSLQVNFATDKTDILPESQPQIDQVLQLLKDDPALKLVINGHTDNSGTAAHNQQLSEGRAKSVVAALTARGIDVSRLSAKGFGQDVPVADNATEEGKAKNRRVELVKL
jgi:outer membrane protein OmpA-like peptidoglycan-associated protein